MSTIKKREEMDEVDLLNESEDYPMLETLVPNEEL